MANTDEEGLGTRLHAVREARGLSPRDLQSITGVDHSTVSRIEAGGQGARVSTLTKLAAALNVTVEWLSTGLGPRDRAPIPDAQTPHKPKLPPPTGSWDFADAVPREVAQLLADENLAPVTGKELLQLCDMAVMMRGSSPDMARQSRVDSLLLWLLQMRGQLTELAERAAKIQARQQREAHERQSAG